MKSHTSAISSTCRLFILGFTLIQGYDAFAYEDILTSNPSCYGATFDSFVNADCGYNSRLIFPLEVFVGAKPNSTGCKTYDDEYGENDPLREQCCRHIDGDHDCRDEYDGENRTVFMTNCVGRNKCEQTRTVWKSTIDMGCNVSGTYKEVSNYAYLEYYCIAKTRMGTPMKDLKLRSRGNPLYLTAGSVDAYWDGILENNVTCSVKTSNKSVVEVWTMDVRLNMSTLQHVEIDNGASLKILDNSYNNSFHPTLILNDTYSVNITLKTNKHNAEFIWLGFRANSSNDFVEISCDESGRFYIADQDVPLSEAEKTIGLMIGSAAGGLCFLAICIILGIVIYRRYRFRKVGEEIKNLPENEEIE